ncbi:MAG TPA: glycosyltransferase [Thiobacillaceae bacterium]|nr:glycosyltransferase [Thiobacillaceae bacterium]
MQNENNRFYVPVRLKFAASVIAALAWAILSYFIAQRWIEDLSALVGMPVALVIIFGIAIIPGFMNAFLVSSLLLDRRPPLRQTIEPLPAISIIVAAYNEQDHILETLESIERQEYGGPLEVIVVNDGSTDATQVQLTSFHRPWLRVLNLEHNGGKAAALNQGLAIAAHPIVITVDGDSYLYKDALKKLVLRYLNDPVNTAAVAGAVLVRNSRHNLVTKVQEWDYFHGIAAIKRLQSLYHGTLVAQGAFSLYRADVLKEVGGWKDTVGEDIVLTWAILERGYRVGFAENACLFTNAPEAWRQFIRQRQRWSRGLIEAFKAHWRLLFRRRMSTLFIWWNLSFPYLDLVYTFIFIPGVVLALAGYYFIAGPLTLLVLPLAMLVNFIMYRIQNGMFHTQHLKVRKNVLGFMFYSLFYSLVLQPACVVGYFKELFLRDKNWGTK